MTYTSSRSAKCERNAEMASMRGMSWNSVSAIGWPSEQGYSTAGGAVMSRLIVGVSGVARLRESRCVA